MLEVRRTQQGYSTCSNKDFDIHIEGGVIQKVELSRGIYDYHHGEGFYVMVE